MFAYLERVLIRINLPAEMYPLLIAQFYLEDLGSSKLPWDRTSEARNISLVLTTP